MGTHPTTLILMKVWRPKKQVSYSTRHKVVAISLSFQSSSLLFTNLSNSLVIVVLLMLPLFGMLFQMRFVPLPPGHLSESSLKPTCTPKHTQPSLDHPLVFSVVLDPSSLDIKIWLTAFLVLLRLRVLLDGEIKHYKSPLRIRISRSVSLTRARI